MKYLSAFLASTSESEYLQNLQNQTCVIAHEANPEYLCPEPPTEPTEPREPGDDDDVPIDRAWLAEFNRLIGRAQPTEENPR